MTTSIFSMLVPRVLIETIIICIVTMGIITMFDTFDEEVNLKLKTKDMILISIVSLITSVVINMNYLFINSDHIIILICAMLLIIMAYTDFKTMQVYTVLGLILFVLSKIYFCINFKEFSLACEINSTTIPLLIISTAILVVLIATQGVGLGDSLVYLSLLMMYITNKDYGALLLVLNILISNASFIISNSIKFIKDRKQKLPLVPYILFAWLLLMFIH